ncbi:hypothetical protein [Aquimarina algiphila]|uniref:hypothetical protein n=1 Tax=Aquimarina algiphila TaxID=2047982 RepID=UPI002492FBCC|nr:hypothetical protein [Aquimarina algiphila]
MMFPELIFGIIALILVRHTIWNIKVYMRKKNLKRLIRNIILSIMIVGFSWIWFVPIHVGQIGESPVCKFRFQVFEYEVHDYSGYGNIQDLLIRTVPVKYGAFDFYKKIGGWKEYFGLKKAEYQTYEEYFGKEAE